MFGYDLKPMEDKRNIQMANPEKAFLDLLYLYPFYDNQGEMEELRLDDDYLKDELDEDLRLEFGSSFQSKTLQGRLDLLLKTYGL